MALDAIESERKLDAPAGFAMPELHGVVEGVVAVDLPERRMAATYVDTPDLRLLRAGVALRHRVEREADGVAVSEWTLKLPLGGAGPLLRRRELRWPGGEEVVPAEADALVRPWRRLEGLVPVARLVQVRQRTELRRSGVAVAEVDDDVVSVMDGPHLTARFRQVEVELAADAPRRLLPAVLARLEAAGAHGGDDRSKIERVLGPSAGGGPDVAARPPGARGRLADVVAWAAATAWAELAGHHAGLVLGGEPEEVAAALAATTRLAGELAVLAPTLDPAWSVATRHDLGWLGALLGELHRLDVVAGQVRAAGAALPDEDQAAVAALRAELDEARSAARATLGAALAGERHAGLLDRLALAASHPPLAWVPEPVADDPAQEDDPAEADGPEADDALADDALAEGAVVDDDGPGPGSPGGGSEHRAAPAGRGRHRRGPRAAAALPALLGPALAALLDALDRLDGPPGAADLGAVAAALAAVRHGAALAEGPCGDPAERLAAVAGDLDGVVADLAETTAAAAWLRAAGLAGSAPVALAAGQLLGAAEAAAAEARSGWAKPARRLGKAKLRAWLEP